MDNDLSTRLAMLTGEQRATLLKRLQSSAKRDQPVPTEPPLRPSVRQGLGFSVFFFSAEAEVPVRTTYELVMNSVRFADAHDFEAVWVPERHFNAFGAPFPNPGLLAGAIATGTERVAVRAGSVVLPLHDPLYIAEDWAVVDNISGGRAGVSLASGWHVDDFVMAPGNYEQRRDIMAEAAGTLRRLWAGESIERTNGLGRKIEVRAFPTPAQREIPLWLTAAARPETWELAGRLGVNVLTALLDQTVEEVAGRVKLYRKTLADYGHPSDKRVTLMLHTHLASSADLAIKRAREPLMRYLRQHMELYAKYAETEDLGIDPASVTEADKTALAEMAFRRYVHTSGLFGSAESTLGMVGKLVDSGVNELACLIDFGCDPDSVLDGLVHLNALRELCQERGIGVR